MHTSFKNMFARTAFISSMLFGLHASTAMANTNFDMIELQGSDIVSGTISRDFVLAKDTVINTKGLAAKLTGAVCNDPGQSYALIFVGGGVITFDNETTAIPDGKIGYSGPTLFDHATTVTGIPKSSLDCSTVYVDAGKTYSESGTIQGVGSLYIRGRGDVRGGTFQMATPSGENAVVSYHNYTGQTIIKRAILQVDNNDVLPVSPYSITPNSAVVLWGQSLSDPAVLKAGANFDTLANPVCVLDYGEINIPVMQTLRQKVDEQQSPYAPLVGSGDLTICGGGTFIAQDGNHEHTGNLYIGSIADQEKTTVDATKLTDTAQNSDLTKWSPSKIFIVNGRFKAGSGIAVSPFMLGLSD